VVQGIKGKEFDRIAVDLRFWCLPGQSAGLILLENGLLRAFAPSNPSDEGVIREFSQVVIEKIVSI